MDPISVKLFSMSLTFFEVTLSLILFVIIFKNNDKTLKKYQ